MIEARGLVKRYGSTTAVDNLSFDVRPGTVTGFLGPNGAGKSTTMRMMLGLDRPDAGTVRINGKNYRDLRSPLREVGALLEAKAFHPGRTARSHLTALAASNGIPRRRVNDVLEITGMDKAADRRAGKFSLGMAQRLGIAAALLGDPAVLLLDEPVNGLDPEGIRWIRNLLKNLAAHGRTVLVSSHLISEVAQTADQLIVIGQGRLLAQTTVAELVRPQQLPRRGVLPAHRGQHRVFRDQHRVPGEPVMTTATLTRSATRTAGGYGFRSVARMEWLKLRSVRSTAWVLLVFAAGMIGLAILVMAHQHWATMSAADRASFDPTNDSFAGLALGQLALGVLGVLAITTEFSSGMIRATLAAVPRRPLLLAAKAAVLGAVTLVAGEILAFAAFAVGEAVLRSPAPHATLGQPGVLRAVLMAGAYPGLIALIGLGLGAVIRHTAGAICAVVGILFVLPLILVPLGYSIQNSVGQFMPMLIAENSLTAVKPQSHTLSPGLGLGMLCLYAVAALAVGSWLLARRDA